MTNFDTNFDDDFTNEEELGTSVATLDMVSEVQAPPREWTGPRCEKCDAPLKSGIVSICRSCGWYPSLSTFVEVDPDWETEEDTAGPVAAEPQKSHIRVWLDLMPRWSWVILASVMTVVLESVVIRLVTPAGNSIRTMWSLGQLGIGIMTVIVCHIFNFLVLAAADADFGVIDIFLRPLKLWIKAVQNLPTRLWVTNSAACGLTGVIMSLLVIGGLPYERLWDWGFQEPVKQNLMGAIMDRAKELDSRNGSDNLEDAVKDFAGDEDLDGDGIPDSQQQETPREKSDCVILGYQVDRDGRLSSLVLGAVHRGQLAFVGRVTPEMPADQLDTLLRQLKVIHSRQAFIVMEAEATWVQPKLTCRITYGQKLKSGKLRDIKWDSLLGVMNTGR